MEIWHAALLGIVQGLSEFLPISSSGHLILVEHLLGVAEEVDGDAMIAFNVALHGGTLLAVFTYFRVDIANLIRGLVSSLRERSLARVEQRLPWLIGLGMVPALLFYLAAGSWLRGLEDKPAQVAVMLIAFSFVFLIAERFRGERTLEDVTPGRMLAIGAGQAIALIPGVSRSGASISAGLFCGLEREQAARASFLLAAPTVAAAFLLEIGDIAKLGNADTQFAVATAVGFVCAAVSGYLAVSGLLRFLANHSLGWFTLYRIPVGVVMLYHFM